MADIEINFDLTLPSGKPSKRKYVKSAEEIDFDLSVLDEKHSAYAELANILYVAMNSYHGTDLCEIESVFRKLKTVDNFGKVSTAFGRRDNKTLIEWLHFDLDPDELNDLLEILD